MWPASSRWPSSSATPPRKAPLGSGGGEFTVRLDRNDKAESWRGSIVTARGGPTSRDNLACLCTRHHTLKTETPWVARQFPDGSIEWTSPLGRVITDRPERYVAFVPEPDPPPF